MGNTPIQTYYNDGAAICFGCGTHNRKGLQIKTFWNGEEGICHFTPAPYHTAFPGVVYGGLIAALIDCHAIGTAIAATYDAEGRKPGTDPKITYVTGSLQVRYVRPAPISGEMVLRAKVKEIHRNKALVTCSLSAEGNECANGEVIAVRAPWRSLE